MGTQTQTGTLTKYEKFYINHTRRSSRGQKSCRILDWEQVTTLCKMDRKLRLLLIPVTLATLYLFTSSLSLLSRSFRLLSSHLDQGELLASARMTSPVIGLAIGILATSLLQSSSATTSLVVAMVASGTITVEQGIPVVMGTNIGTSLTSTVIALYHIKQSNEYRLGFTAAIMTDLFNWMTVLVLLPLEMFTGFLAGLSKLLVDKILTDHETPSSHLASSNPLSFLDAILDPLVDSIVILKPPSLSNCFSGNSTDKMSKLPSPAVLAKLAKLAKLSISDGEGAFGRHEESFGGEDDSSAEESEEDSLETGMDDSMESVESIEESLMENSGNISISSSCSILATDCDGGCNFLFADSGLTDEAIGAIILVFTIVIFIGSFVIMVRSLKFLLQTEDEVSWLSQDIPHVPPFATELLLVVAGFLITILVHSSSAVTSAIVPLASQGTLSLERCYAITVGANLGTTTTGIIAALAASGQRTRFALQLALCHCIFNISGIILFYALPFMRWPLLVAKIFGQKVDKYKWFSVFFLIMSFFVIPATIYGLSLLITILGGLITFLQKHRRNWLPRRFRDWSFLPKQLRSFAIIDYVVQTYMEVFCCCIVERSVMLRLEGRLEDQMSGHGSNVLQLGLGANLQLVKVQKK